mmetsp:Transcript_34172/g.62428  ORF Transcript_34172/g.62428 Transcript_34172/m.62428 type:complete len:372 (-) Transcript_34172:291-1406(-)
MPTECPSQRSACRASWRATSLAAALRKQRSSSSPWQPYNHLQVPVYCPGLNQTAVSLQPAVLQMPAAAQPASPFAFAAAASPSTRVSSSPTFEHLKTSCGRSASVGESGLEDEAARSARHSESTASESIPARLVFRVSPRLPKWCSRSCSSRAPAALEALAAGPAAAPSSSAALPVLAPAAASGGFVASSNAFMTLYGSSIISRVCSYHHLLSKSLKHCLHRDESCLLLLRQSEPHDKGEEHWLQRLSGVDGSVAGSVVLTSASVAASRTGGVLTAVVAGRLDACASSSGTSAARFMDSAVTKRTTSGCASARSADAVNTEGSAPLGASAALMMDSAEMQRSRSFGASATRPVDSANVSVPAAPEVASTCS